MCIYLHEYSIIFFLFVHYYIPLIVHLYFTLYIVYMTLNQIKLNPFSSRVVTLLKWTSLLFFIIGATSTFIDTYRGLDGVFVIFGLTVNLISLIFYILSISLLIFGDILSEIVRIKDESDYII